MVQKKTWTDAGKLAALTVFTSKLLTAAEKNTGGFYFEKERALAGLSWADGCNAMKKILTTANYLQNGSKDGKIVFTDKFYSTFGSPVDITKFTKWFVNKINKYSSGKKLQWKLMKKQQLAMNFKKATKAANVKNNSTKLAIVIPHVEKKVVIPTQNTTNGILQNRFNELASAIQTYTKNNLSVPAEWASEHNVLLKMLEK